MTGSVARPGVLLDGALIDRHYGYGRYVRELAYALDRHADIDLTVLTTPRGAETARRLMSRSRVEVVEERPFPLWEQVTVPSVARRLGAAVVHFPYQTSAWAWARSATVVTLHDLIPHDPVPVGLSASDRLAHFYRRWTWNHVSRHAAGIVSVSESTAEALQARFGLASVVVPNTVEGFAALNPPHADRWSSPRRYLLHRGGTAPHKNTARVVEAFLAVREGRPELSLEIFGLAPSQAPALARNVPGIHVRERLDDASLAQLYRGAEAVVMPSLEEGFGLPILEGFAFDVPVITSDRAPMSEIARDGAAILVDPTSAGAIAGAMSAVLDDQELRARLRARGASRLDQYGARRVATTLTDLYRRILLAAPPALARTLR